MTETERLADVIAFAVHTATAPLLAKIAVLEARPFVTDDLIYALKEAAADTRSRLIAVESKVTDAHVSEMVKSVCRSYVKDAIDAIPIPRDGRDGVNGADGAIGPMGPQGLIGEKGLDGAMGPMGPQGPAGEQGLDGLQGLPGPKGEDGAAGPMGPQGERGAAGERGADGVIGPAGPKGAPGVVGPTGEPGERGERGEAGPVGPAGPVGDRGEMGPIGPPGPVGARGEKGLDGVDGIGITNATITAEGRLMLLMTNGKSLDAGIVRGADGMPGRDGRDGLPGLVGQPGEKGMDGKDGRDGVDGLHGKDGRGFNEFDLDFETKELILRERSGDTLLHEERRFLPFTRHMGVFVAGTRYLKGDQVSVDGAQWIATETTIKRPGGDDSGWQLSAKRGPEGKRGPQGPEGKPGRDLTQLGSDGRKW
jgi:integrin beta 3